jgi:hypothetical protein
MTFRAVFDDGDGEVWCVCVCVGDTEENPAFIYFSADALLSASPLSANGFALRFSTKIRRRLFGQDGVSRRQCCCH